MSIELHEVCSTASAILAYAESIDAFRLLTMDEKLLVMKTLVSVLENKLKGRALEVMRRQLLPTEQEREG